MRRNITIAITLLVLLSAHIRAADVPTATPESVGMSSSTLAKVTELIKQRVADGKIAGGVVVVARRGKVAFFKSYGKREWEGRRYLNPKSIRVMTTDQLPQKAIPIAFGSQLEPHADRKLLKQIAELPDNSWMKLPPVKTAGDLSWLSPKSDYRRQGPRIRDYCNKMVWAPERVPGRDHPVFEGPQTVIRFKGYIPRPRIAW